MLVDIIEYIGAFLIAKILFLIVRELYFILRSDPDV